MKPALAHAPAIVDPAREELAQAQTRLGLAKKRVEVAKAAVDRFWQHRMDAQDAFSAAEAAFEAAKIAMVDATVDGAQVPSIREAKEAVENALDVLNALNGGEERLKSERSAADDALMVADMTLRHAIRAVVKSDERVQMLIANFKTTQREYVKLQWQIAFLDGKNCLPDVAKGWDNNQREWPELAAIPVAWKAAFAGLEHDANALLPE